MQSADRWKKFGRKVRDGEKPLKKVKSAFNPDKLVLMFGGWQTEKFTLKVTNGKIPVVSHYFKFRGIMEISKCSM